MALFVFGKLAGPPWSRQPESRAGSNAKISASGISGEIARALRVKPRGQSSGVCAENVSEERCLLIVRLKVTGSFRWGASRFNLLHQLS